MPLLVRVHSQEQCRLLSQRKGQSCDSFVEMFASRIWNEKSFVLPSKVLGKIVLWPSWTQFETVDPVHFIVQSGEAAQRSSPLPSLRLEVNSETASGRPSSRVKAERREQNFKTTMNETSPMLCFIL